VMIALAGSGGMVIAGRVIQGAAGATILARGLSLLSVAKVGLRLWGNRARRCADVRRAAVEVSFALGGIRGVPTARWAIACRRAFAMALSRARTQGLGRDFAVDTHCPVGARTRVGVHDRLVEVACSTSWIEGGSESSWTGLERVGSSFSGQSS
jgi:hypothetical protein